ncbi:MAG TPA: DUF2846 domain-containing protein [Allosphingosinicella sp.]|nr:DUF2846 domain-containing protein [Allosphingosinicella sp.]
MRKSFGLALAASACLLATGAPAQDAAAPTERVSMTGNTLAAPPEGMGQVVFFRKSVFGGRAISCAVHENGQKISSLPPGNFAVIAATPGVHNYSVKSEATDTLRLEVEAGETYYAKCSIGMGFMAGRPNLSPSDEATFEATKLKPVKKES